MAALIHHRPPQVLVAASCEIFISRRYPVPLGSDRFTFTLVLVGVELGRIVEVIKQKVHLFLDFALEVVGHTLISLHLYVDFMVPLVRQCSRSLKFVLICVNVIGIFFEGRFSDLSSLAVVFFNPDHIALGELRRVEVVSCHVLAHLFGIVPQVVLSAFVPVLSP